MRADKIDLIEHGAVESLAQANRILTGDGDNYDGADGAREIAALCYNVLDLCEALRLAKVRLNKAENKLSQTSARGRKEVL